MKYFSALLVTCSLIVEYSCMPYRIRTCTDLQPLYLLNHVIPNRYSLPRGVSIEYDQKNTIHAYRLTEHAGSINFPASDIFTRCSYWPEEYSVLATFRVPRDSDIPDWDGGYLFSLIPDARVDLKLGLSVSRAQTVFYYSDYAIRPGDRRVTFQTNLFDDKWHTMVLTVAGNSVALRIDCGDKMSMFLDRTFPAFLDTSGDNIHVGNRKIQPGQFRGYIKQLLVLPGADASLLACPSSMPMLPDISRQPDVQMEADGPYETVYHIPYDAECQWTETGKMWYDIYSRQLKVCLSGAWKQASPAQNDAAALIQLPHRLDYFQQHAKVAMPSPALDIRVFTIPKVGQFIMMANWDSTAKRRKQNSMLYKWEKDLLQPYQNISTSEPSSITSFQIGERFFLAIANMRARSRRLSEVVTVYVWSGNRQKFRPFQDLNSQEPRDVEAFQINGVQFLAVANHVNDGESDKDGEYDGKSLIWRYDEVKDRFMEYQKISTTGAWDFTYFYINTPTIKVHCLAIANAIDESGTKLQSSLFYWSEAERSFLLYQTFQTYGATDWEHFNIDGETYLAVANGVYTNSTSDRYSTTSVIYKADIATQRFEEVQQIDTYGILDWEYFMVGNDSYLIGSNQQARASRDLTTRQRETVVYRWQGAERFVPVHRLLTSPSADWEAIYSGESTYLIYANGESSVTELYKAKLQR